MHMLNHLALLEFKPGTAAEEISELERGFLGLKRSIPTIQESGVGHQRQQGRVE